MECKYNKAGGRVYRGLRINRYIMECKSPIIIPVSCGIVELIDTLWNVNFVTNKQNINQERRINRYIMECKCPSTIVESNLAFMN